MGGKTAKGVVESYLAAVSRHDVSAALGHLRDDFRLEFGGGVTLDKPALERAMGWDRGTSGTLEWTVVSESGRHVAIEGEETNEFLSLLGVGSLPFTSRFEVDGAGLIASQEHSVVWSGPSVDERLAPVVAWAEVKSPMKLAKVYPDGQMIYSETAGRGWVELLRAWRASEEGA